MKLKSYACKTDKGPFFEINEDLFEVDLSENLFMLIDAFGGAGQGDLCAKKIIENMKKIYSHVSGDSDATLPFFYGHQYLLEGNALINAAFSTHQILCEENSEKTMSERSGASGVFLSFSENLVNILSIGNCQTYCYSMGEIFKVYQEDSLDFISSTNSHNLNIPLNAFGFYDYLHFTFKEIKVYPGDYLVMLTDGVYSFLSADEIKAIVEDHADNLNKAIIKMFALANERNNLDNQSCMVLGF